MRRHRNNNWWWILIVFFFVGGFGFMPLLIIAGVLVALAIAAVNTSNKQEAQRNQDYQRGYAQTTSYYRSTRNRYTAAQMAKVNVYLRSWFRTRGYLPLGQDIDLRIKGPKYASLASLNVYRDGQYICSLNDFGRQYPDTYNEILDELVRIADQGAQPQMRPESRPEVIDAEVVQVTPQYRPQEKPQQETVVEIQPEPKKEEPKKAGAQEFIEQIGALNDNIPDEDISNGLYETVALLKQINTLETRFPDSKNKLRKLYDYYLPILVRILQQYDNLQAAKSDPSYEATRKKLSRTIDLINDAMKTIISSLTDQDFINLAADISTLEAVLQKDGLTSEGKMFQTKG